MTKVNITKPTGSVEVLNLLSAFKADNNSYVIFDSERLGSMGLPIIYVSKYTTKLEKINDVNEWQSVKNYLKGIINGTNFQYNTLSDNVSADEVYYTPLTLPQASFELIKSRYVVTDGGNSDTTLGINPATVAPAPVSEVSSNNTNLNSATVNVIPTEPIRPNSDVVSNTQVNSTVLNNTIAQSSVSEEIKPEQPATIVVPQEPTINLQNTNNEKSNFENDKETFLKACENMFDALISKYQKQLSDIERREQELVRKEQEIETKLKNANEHLANAEARETVANIAHDNAQKIMDISSLMPNNPNDNQTGVI